jgi:hypothetical protein
MPTVQIDHLRSLLIYAFRYTLGRGSYAPGEMMEILRAQAHELRREDRELIWREIRAGVGPNTPYRAEWLALAEEMGR